MTFTPEQVEMIVLEVIRRLGLLDTNRQRERGIGGSTELRLTEKVITTRTIEGHLAGVSRLIIPKRAVVTPAVRDELKKRNIELVRQKP
jgi:hypothetical protein